jgi:hypothetical protein
VHGRDSDSDGDDEHQYDGPAAPKEVLQKVEQACWLARAAFVLTGDDGIDSVARQFRYAQELTSKGEKLQSFQLPRLELLDKAMSAFVKQQEAKSATLTRIERASKTGLRDAEFLIDGLEADLPWLFNSIERSVVTVSFHVFAELIRAVPRNWCRRLGNSLHSCA